jgi:hypothetical protein
MLMTNISVCSSGDNQRMAQGEANVQHATCIGIQYVGEWRCNGHHGHWTLGGTTKNDNILNWSSIMSTTYNNYCTRSYEV